MSKNSQKRLSGAAKKTRTSTGFRPQRPQRCASTNSAMAARASTGRRAPLAKRSRTRNNLCSTPCDGKSVAERHSLKNPACQSFVWGYDKGFHPLFHLRHMVKAAFTFDGVCPFASAIGRDPRYGADAACACESGWHGNGSDHSRRAGLRRTPCLRR